MREFHLLFLLAFVVVAVVASEPCPCIVCPCPNNVLPRTCDSPSVAASLPFCDVSKPVQERIADLVSRLSREEKINLVKQVDTGFLPRLNLKEFRFYRTCMHGWWTGGVTTFGMPVGMAATFDLSLMRQIAEVVGVESRALSQRDYNKSFDPVTGYHGVALDWLVCKDGAEVNMNRHPLWGRNPETYGEDPYLTATMGETFTRQLQQPDPSSRFLRTSAVTRHLVVYSGPENLKDDNTRGADRYAFNAIVSERDLEDYFYPPFEACLNRDRGGSAGAMCSDAAQNGIPSCASELLMKQKPKDWNARDDFYVVADRGSAWHEYTAHQYGANTTDALFTSLHAGLDFLYLRDRNNGPLCRGNGVTADDCPDTAGDNQEANETHDAFELATNGSQPDPRFTLTDLDAKTVIALQMRFNLGEFDPVAGNPYAQPVDPSVIDGAAHRKVARDATAASVVLLKNDGDVLPLSKSMQVAAIGPWMKPDLQPSMNHYAPPYVHAYAGSSSLMDDFLEGISSRLASPPVFVQGCESNQPSQSDPEGKFAAARAAASAADVTILAVGLTTGVEDADGVGLEEEQNDRLSLHLPKVQLDLIAALRPVAKKLVLVVVSGSAVPFNESLADAALYAMYGGEAAGAGLADVLFGDVSPSGRLPFTVFESLEQIRPMGDYDLTTQPGRTHLFYDDESVATYGAPQFWFGFGLSYSRFAYSQATLLVETGARGDCVMTANVTVSNEGSTVAREVAQLYLKRPPLSGVPMAQWALRGYQRTAPLAPGASTTLHFQLGFQDLSTVQSDGSRTLTPGAYTIEVGGGHPRDTRAPATPAVAVVDVAAACTLLV